VDKDIPRLAGIAVKQAYERALLIGGKVMTSDHGRLVEIRADGGMTEIRKLPERIRVTLGATVLRKPAR
jgi:hypothetical protein